MAAPTLTPVGERLYEALAPLAFADAEHGWALAIYCAASARMLDEVAALSRDTDDGRPGWTDVLDPDRAPEGWLPWLGAFVGVDIPDWLDEGAKRLRVRETAGFRRGSPEAIRGAARQLLTGQRRVYLTERHGSPYRYSVSTFASETPDAEAVERALVEQKPAGLVMAYFVITGGDFDTLTATHTDFDEVSSIFDTFDDVLADPARQD